MCDELEDTINKNYIHQLLQKNAAYEALQASVNPHFLYNSLEAPHGPVETDSGGDGVEDDAAAPGGSPPAFPVDSGA